MPPHAGYIRPHHCSLSSLLVCCAVYSLVSRDVSVLAEYQVDGLTGNFSTISRVLLRKIQPGVDERRSFQHDNHAFHYIQHDDLVYMLMADKDIRPSRAFAFLQHVQERFISQYGARAKTAVAFAFNADFSRALKQEMERFNAVAGDDKFQAIRSNLNDVKEQVHTHTYTPHSSISPSPTTTTPPHTPLTPAPPPPSPIPPSPLPLSPCRWWRTSTR